MTTRSTIAIDIGAGVALWVRCHCDGYPEHNGAVLLEHWNTKDLAEALVKGGDVNALRRDGSFNHAGVPRGDPKTERTSNLCGYRNTYVWTGGRWMLDGLPLTAFDTVKRDREYDEHKLRAIAGLMTGDDGDMIRVLANIKIVLASVTDEYRVTS